MPGFIVLILNLLYTLFDFVEFVFLAASDDVACFVCQVMSVKHALTIYFSHIIYSGPYFTVTSLVWSAHHYINSSVKNWILVSIKRPSLHQCHLCSHIGERNSDVPLYLHTISYEWQSYKFMLLCKLLCLPCKNICSNSICTM